MRYFKAMVGYAVRAFFGFVVGLAMLVAAIAVAAAVAASTGASKPQFGPQVEYTLTVPMEQAQAQAERIHELERENRDLRSKLEFIVEISNGAGVQGKDAEANRLAPEQPIDFAADMKRSAEVRYRPLGKDPRFVEMLSGR